MHTQKKRRMKQKAVAAAIIIDKRDHWRVNKLTQNRCGEAKM